jgi:hypothetical protein
LTLRSRLRRRGGRENPADQTTVGAIDFDASVTSYQAFGLALTVSSRGEHARLGMPQGETTLSVHLQDGVSSTGAVLYLEVDDVDNVVNDLKAKVSRSRPAPKINHGSGERRGWLIRQVIACVSSELAITAGITAVSREYWLRV